MPFSEYAAYMKMHRDVEPLYLFQEFDRGVRAAIDPSLRPPPAFDDDFLATVIEPPTGFTGLDGWLLVGPPCSGSRWHFDPWGTAAWNLLFDGSKLWAFMPPSDGEGSNVPTGVRTQALGGGLAVDPRLYYSAPPALENLASCIERCPDGLLWALQEPGDLIFIPSGWWHSTVCLTCTSAYTRNYINDHNFRRAITALSSLHPSVAKQLQQWVWRKHMDDDDSDDAPTEHSRADTGQHNQAHRLARSR